MEEKLCNNPIKIPIKRMGMNSESDRSEIREKYSINNENMFEKSLIVWHRVYDHNYH